VTVEAQQAIGGLRQMLTKHELTNSKRYDLNQVIGYLERNRKHMRYKICLTKGYPVGNGVIEGTCPNLINDRLELAGMSWTLPGAESMMRPEGRSYQKGLGHFLEAPTSVRKATTIWL